jgi:hypothetical protein
MKRLALGALLCVGCGHGTPAPDDALQTFGAALERGDWAAAYGQMSASYRRSVPLAEFRRQMEAAPADARDAGRMLREHAERWGNRVEVRAGGDERIQLVREGSLWRLERPPFEPFGQETPRAALRSFIRAVETARYDVLIQLAPARYRGEITTEKLRRYWEGQGPERTKAMLRDLRVALEGRIVEEGDEAFLVYGTGRQVRFVREEAQWRIESPE